MSVQLQPRWPLPLPPQPNHVEGGLSRYLDAFLPASPSFLPFLQLIKEKLLDLLGKEEEEGSHDENVVRAAGRGLQVG